MSRPSSASPLRRALSFLTLAIFFSLLSLDLPAAVLEKEAQPALDPPNLPLTQAPFVQVRDRITSFIDDDQRVTLRGNVHPLAQAQYDAGAVAPDFPMEHMLLTLLPDSTQQDVLNQLVDAQHNPESPYYHQWLTPEQYGERFGVSDADTAQIVSWLQEHGMQVEEVTAGRRSIIFSGTAAQVQTAFHTAIHTYKIGDEVHHANVNDPEIPAALVQVVGGVVSLHDFHSEPMHGLVRKPSPDFSSGGAYYLAPADFATIYDLNPLYQQSITGSGQSVAIVARSNINIADARQFRTFFGLPANDPQIIVNGTDPGIWSANEETEADLDVEWSGAVARSATIKFVVSKSTNSSDGVDLSAQYIVNHNLAPVMSTSFGLCEASLGSSGNSFLNSLWQQAAAEGITVFVSSGDSGAAGCDSA
ncbi:MAG: protease pro-enzyme activation domain-containing protein, partial [Candidatus Sulfotelmatobacter sp.]